MEEVMLKRVFIVFILMLALLVAPGTAVSGSININQADSEQLVTLPGIGPALAERIIEHREEFPFEAKEDIMQVSGIGESRFQEIKDMISVK